MSPLIGLFIAIVAGLVAPKRRAVVGIVIPPMLGATAAQSWYLGTGRGNNPAATTTNSPAYWIVQALIITAICGVAAAVCWLRMRRGVQLRTLPSGSQRGAARRGHDRSIHCDARVDVPDRSAQAPRHWKRQHSDRRRGGRRGRPRRARVSRSYLVAAVATPPRRLAAAQRCLSNRLDREGQCLAALRVRRPLASRIVGAPAELTSGSQLPELTASFCLLPS